jgi:integrase/recombinase XerD
MLTVTGKNDQARLVPVHATTVTMLTGYATRRDRLGPDTASPAFFITRTGQRIQQRWVQQTFAKLLVLANIQTPPGRRRPRSHDYADLRVMPTSASKPWWMGVIAVSWSA